MTNLKLFSSIPLWIKNEVDRLKKYLPDNEVDKNLSMIVENKQYGQQFFVNFYVNVQQWGVQSFCWNRILRPKSREQQQIGSIIHSTSLQQQAHQHKQNQLLAKNKKLTCILNCIEHIAFINLKTLYITESGITSIQALTWINMETLKVIAIMNNNITSLKPLAKCRFRGLANVDTVGNPYPIHQLAPRYFNLNNQIVTSLKISLKYILSIYHYIYTIYISFITLIFSTLIITCQEQECNPQNKRRLIYGYMNQTRTINKKITAQIYPQQSSTKYKD